MVVNVEMGKKNYCFICQFKLQYHPEDLEKIFDTVEIAKIYLSMKEELKNAYNLIHRLVTSGIIILK